MSGLVVAEVGASDATGGWRSPLAVRTDRKALVTRLRHEREPLAIRAPLQPGHAVLELGELPRLAAVEGQDPGLGDRIVVPDRGPQERETTTVRCDLG